MENTVTHKIRNRIARAKFGEVFFVSSFPKYNVEYMTKLLVPVWMRELIEKNRKKQL